MKILSKIFGGKRGEPAGGLPAKSFADRRQIEEYVADALRRAVPSGWRVLREDSKRLWWTIKRVSIPQGEWHDQDYSLFVSEDLQWFILTHGNKDCGVWGLGHALLDAMVISASSLQLPGVSAENSVGLPQFHLSECVRFVIEHRKPNEWGYT